jgi:hypothetical protein
LGSLSFCPRNQTGFEADGEPHGGLAPAGCGFINGESIRKRGSGLEQRLSNIERMATSCKSFGFGAAGSGNIALAWQLSAEHDPSIIDHGGEVSC